MLTKTRVIETIGDFPEEFTMDELFEKMIVIEKIEKGLEQAKKGESISEEQLDIEIETWFK